MRLPCSIDATPAATARSRATGGAKPSALVAHADEGFGYETMFLLMAEGSRSLDVDAIRIHLETIGESVLVAGDPLAEPGLWRDAARTILVAQDGRIVADRRDA